jgi:dipeptidyl aminopeptidase/acylaminoacyl peptidase
MLICKTWSVLLFGLLFSASALCADVDLSPWVTHGTYGDIKISPKGDFYAATLQLADRKVVIVIRRADKKITAKIAGPVRSGIDDFWWVNDERLVVSMAEQFGSLDQPVANGELHAVNADGSGARLIAGHRYDSQTPGSVSYGGLEANNLSHFVDDLRNDKREILISTAELGNVAPLTRIERLDVYNARRKPVARAPVRRARFLADGKGVVRFAQGAESDNASKLYYRDSDDDDWRLINDELQSGRIETPYGFSADDSLAYLEVDRETGPAAVVALELATGKRTEVLRDAVVDPAHLLYDFRGVAVGAAFTHDGVRTRFFDEKSAAAKFQRLLERTFPGAAVRISSTTSDGLLSVFGIYSDREPGAFFLFDHTAKKAQFIFNVREGIDPERMAASTPIQLKAGDGLTLHGFLTRPSGADPKKPAPLIVMPHGGPFGIFDEWGFDTDTQLLALAGYNVLRINFRGSGNYGRAFMMAGAREWGGRMQDDVTDATRWAITEKIADPERICIVGASYGAYAALLGAARQPDLYRCAVGYVGVYDLPLFYKADAKYARWSKTWVEQWIGSEGMESRSPNRLADRIKAPVFLAAGGEDWRAPIKHSELMERALKAADVPVETLYFDSEGHGFYTEEHRRAYYKQLLDFLSRHLGGAKGK